MGGTRAGNILKTAELALAATRRGAWSFSEIIDVLHQYREEIETEEMPAEPGRKDVVRVMNLHKAKGLEAAVVFLADPLKDSDHGPELHIDRIAGVATGYFLATVPGNHGGSKAIGIPPRWEEKEAVEERYAEAEEDRLLYVATTRAKQLLVVSRYPSKPDKGAWKDLEPHLTQREELEERFGEIVEKAPGVVSREEFMKARARIDDVLSKSKSASYDVQTATGIVEEQAIEKPFSGEGGMGMKWGEMIHKALRILLTNESVDLDVLAEGLLRQNGIPAGEKDGMVAHLEAVVSSGFWKRIANAKKRLCEAPFAIQADGPLPRTLSGIIDLVFLEHDGWVIVDYKSDRIDGNLDKLVEYYSPQVNIYRKSWDEIAGQKVKEAGIYFTSVDQWVTVAEKRGGN